MVALPITYRYTNKNCHKTMLYTEKQVFKISPLQKETLKRLKTKYNINTSAFIRSAIDEKLTRDKQALFKKDKNIAQYLQHYNDCPY